MYVTENDVADAGNKLRVEYLLDHLGSIYELIKDGVDVRGYFYWSLLDNYSWLSEYKSRFGLYSADMTMKKRSPTNVVEVYRQIASENRLPD
jgi:beta-glucosidase